MKQNKLLAILLLSTIISFLLGIFFITILSTSNKNLIYTNITNYLETIKTNNINYLSILLKSLSTNLFSQILIWILGISLIGVILIFLCLLFKAFLLGFTLSSIIYHFKFKGVIFSIIYIIPHLLNFFIYFFLSYYALSFSIMLFNYFFRKKDYNRKVIVKRYLKIFIISFFILIISSILETFLIPSIIKYFCF